MQPLRSHHRVERTPQGESAWRLQALSPFERNLLGSLRTPLSVSDMLRAGSWSPSELETALLRMARLGWVLIQEPTVAVSAPEEDVPRSEEIEDASELEALLRRHRSEQEAPLELDPILPPQPQATVRGHPDSVGADAVQPRAPVAPVQIDPVVSRVVPQHDPYEPLPFNKHAAEDDGLLEALRHPETAAEFQENRPEWAPPSGGLAALLRALGEPVPEGVEVSPDQEERLHGLTPVEPWGGSFSPSAPELDAAGENAKEAPFPRMRDQPTDDTRPRPNLGALRGSLNKVQQEQAEANAVRDRARQLRQQREDELRKVNERSAANRAKEERGREGTTLLGLSQRLARVKNDREKDD